MCNKIKEKKLNNIKSYIFIIGLVFAIIITDIIVTKYDPVANSVLFNKNDYEKIKLSNTEESYEKVFYGNSAVISAFKESESRSGYINTGMDYATIEDLYKMLDRDMIKIDKELVIGVNYLTFLDSLETNPTYPWHRKSYEPYFYFNRDKIHDLIISSMEMFLDKKEIKITKYDNFDRTIYTGVLSDADLDKKIERYKTDYWNKGIEYYQKNFRALQKVIDYCDKNQVTMRVVFMPWNNYVEKPENVKNIEAKAKDIMNENGIEFIDISNQYSREYFHDLGHLNYEFGAEEFTKEIDEWLIKE